MRNPEDFPADIIAAADAVVERGHNEGLLEAVCRALLAERLSATERAAKIAEKHLRPVITQNSHLTETSEVGKAIAAAIRSQP